MNYFDNWNPIMFYDANNYCYLLKYENKQFAHLKQPLVDSLCAWLKFTQDLAWNTLGGFSTLAKPNCEEHIFCSNRTGRGCFARKLIFLSPPLFHYSFLLFVYPVLYLLSFNLNSQAIAVHSSPSAVACLI